MFKQQPSHKNWGVFNSIRIYWEIANFYFSIHFWSKQASRFPPWRKTSTLSRIFETSISVAIWTKDANSRTVYDIVTNAISRPSAHTSKQPMFDAFALRSVSASVRVLRANEAFHWSLERLKMFSRLLELERVSRGKRILQIT